MRAYFSLGSVRLVSNRVPKDPKKKEKKVADGIYTYTTVTNTPQLVF